MSKINVILRMPNTVWTQDAGRSVVGDEVPVIVGGKRLCTARVAAGEVIDDGHALRLTLDAPAMILGTVASEDEPEDGLSG